MKMTDTASPLLTVAYVSGKGGVGKTMLAVAFAKEISLKVPTLLVDLDFFNRGLTGLMPDGRQVTPLESPDFVSGSSTNASTHHADPDRRTTQDHEDPSLSSSGEWALIQLHNNLYYISYPDLGEEEFKYIQGIDVQLLARMLAEFLSNTAAKCGCECIVLDCHGGPDNTSFAASLVADHTLMISEPDRITLFGTLNFLRQLEAVHDSDTRDVRLVYNKVLPSFSALSLKRFYDKSISKYFAKRPLMGIYPHEMYLTKQFERTPFLTSVYPYSFLTRKTQILIKNLLSQEFSDKIPKVARSMFKIQEWIIWHSLGKRPRFLDFDFVFAFIALSSLPFILALVLSETGLLDSAKTLFADSEDLPIPLYTYAVVYFASLFDYILVFGETYSEMILVTPLIWIPIVFILVQSSRLDRYFTYHVRQNKWARAAGAFAVVSSLWLFSSVLMGTLLGGSWYLFGELAGTGAIDAEFWGILALTSLMLLVFVAVYSDQICAIRAGASGPWIIEVGLRVVLLILVSLGAVFGWYAAWLLLLFFIL